VLTKDLAAYLADAVDAPGVDGQRIDIGWDRPVSMRQIAQLSGRLLDRHIRVLAIPAGVIKAAGAVVGRFNPMVKDLTEMMRWFQTGRYIADPTRQRQVFGPAPPLRTRSPGWSAAWGMRSTLMGATSAENVTPAEPDTFQSGATGARRSQLE